MLEDSTTYQVLLEMMHMERIQELRKILLRLGRIRLGPTNETTERTLDGITDLERLERMTERVLTAQNWQELVATE